MTKGEQRLHGDRLLKKPISLLVATSSLNSALLFVIRTGATRFLPRIIGHAAYASFREERRMKFANAINCAL